MADDNSKSPEEISEATMIVDTNLIRKVRESQQVTRAYLIVLSGPDVGQMYQVDGEEVVLGRAADNQLRIHDAGISRKHARLVRRDDDVYIEDMGSANGTFLNGNKLVKPLQLRDGDKITLGSTTILKFTYHDQLDESFQRQMFEAALRDSLTGAFNKKYFLDQLQKEFSYAKRHRTSLALVMFDVDHFKRINDTYGHLAGDYVLVELSKLAHMQVRSEDIFARYGGEEFAIICRDVTMHQAAALGDRLRLAVERMAFTYHGTRMPLTVSLGVAGIPEIPVGLAEELIEAADTALYAAKNHGRNCVMLATTR